MGIVNSASVKIQGRYGEAERALELISGKYNSTGVNNFGYNFYYKLSMICFPGFISGNSSQ